MPRASTPPWRKKLASSEASTACSITFGISLSLSITRRSRAKVVKTAPFLSIELGDQAGHVARQRVDPGDVDRRRDRDAADRADQQRGDHRPRPAQQAPRPPAGHGVGGVDDRRAALGKRFVLHAGHYSAYNSAEPGKDPTRGPEHGTTDRRAPRPRCIPVQSGGQAAVEGGMPEAADPRLPRGAGARGDRPRRSLLLRRHPRRPAPPALAPPVGDRDLRPDAEGRPAPSSSACAPPSRPPGSAPATPATSRRSPRPASSSRSR